MARRPPDLVNNRTLTAEACASAALALIQHPAMWEALTTLALITETALARRSEGMDVVGMEIIRIIEEVPITDIEAERAVELLSTVDNTARTWARLAHRDTLFGVA